MVFREIIDDKEVPWIIVTSRHKTNSINRTARDKSILNDFIICKFIPFMLIYEIKIIEKPAF